MKKWQERIKPVAVIGYIADSQIGLISGSEKYVYCANERNGLKDILPLLNINSNFGVLELYGRTFVACLGQPVFYRMEVTTDKQKQEAGLIKITSK